MNYRRNGRSRAGWARVRSSTYVLSVHLASADVAPRAGSFTEGDGGHEEGSASDAGPPSATPLKTAFAARELDAGDGADRHPRPWGYAAERPGYVDRPRCPPYRRCLQERRREPVGTAGDETLSRCDRNVPHGAGPSPPGACKQLHCNGLQHCLARIALIGVNCAACSPKEPQSHWTMHLPAAGEKGADDTHPASYPISRPGA